MLIATHRQGKHTSRTAEGAANLSSGLKWALYRSKMGIQGPQTSMDEIRAQPRCEKGEKTHYEYETGQMIRVT